MADEPEEADAEVLAMLRGALGCPADVLKLAEQAMAKGNGLLVEAHNRAWVATSADAVGSSSFNSSRTVLAARVPDPDSMLPNYSRTYYARLRNELEKGLGLPVSVQLFGED